MSTITVTSILNKVAVLLYDVNNIKWSRTELLTYFNSAQRSIVALVPEASATLSVFATTAGNRQTLPSSTNLLLDVTRNLGSGAAPGRAVKRVDMVILDETNPTWSSDPAAAVITMYMYNMRDRYAFYVYPASNGSTSLEIIASIIPSDIAEGAGATVITVADLYECALTDYILWRCYSKAAPFSNDPEKTAMYFKSFSSYIAGYLGDSSKLAAQMGQLAALEPQGQGSA